jgi:uncharacterized protein YodC (DUF2158 family)
MQIKIGESVRLRTGDPHVMTVDDIQDGEVHCTFLNANGDQKFAVFKPESLVVVVPEREVPKFISK